MKGDDAVAVALLRAADAFYTVPGYPITSIASKCEAETVVNEKVGLEYALGESLSGRRSALLVKNVGLNACADPLIQATTQGLRAGVVVVAGDDLDARGSQNAQDSRYYGELAQVPVIEPDRSTISAAVEEAFCVSEQFSRIAILRITTPFVAENAVEGEIPRRRCLTGSLADPDLTMGGRVVEADCRTARMFAWSKASPLNTFKGGRLGAGAAPGDSHAITVYPPPASAEVLVGTEEYGRPFVREHRMLEPPPAQLLGKRFADRGFCRTFCEHCPFKGAVGILRESGLRVICDTGCSLFAANPPYRVGIAGYGLGSSIAVAARSTHVALSGDYAVLHSGLAAMIDASEKRIPLLCIVLANKCMGMVGKQPCPDVVQYIGWADPVVCAASDEQHLRTCLVRPDGFSVVVIEGECPKDEDYGTVTC